MITWLPHHHLKVTPIDIYIPAELFETHLPPKSRGVASPNRHVELPILIDLHVCLHEVLVVQGDNAGFDLGRDGGGIDL